MKEKKEELYNTPAKDKLIYELSELVKEQGEINREK